MNSKLRRIIFLVTFILAFPAWSKECLENRGVIDFGSGTTKLLAVTVDTCEKKVVKNIFDERLALAFNEAFEKAKDGNIPVLFYREALPAIEASLIKMRAFKLTQVTGVATAVFRNAKNGKIVMGEYSKKLDMPIKIISQKEEANLGYWSALASKSLAPGNKPLVVWDIGGGSMQMYALDKGKPRIFEGHLASVSFKNDIISKLQNKDPKQVSSPNPLGFMRAASVQMAKNHASMNVPKFFKELSPDTTCWIGVGGVLSMSVQQQVKKGSSGFEVGEVESALKARALLTDEQIPSDYRISDISNLALVLGYMQALKIQKIETVPASLGQGLIYKSLHTKN